MLSKWLQGVLEAREIGQAELARLLSARLGRSIDRAAVNKMVSGKRGIYADELMEIESITGMSAPTQRTIRVVGYIGAGSEAHWYSEGGNLDEIPAPDYAEWDAVALKIKGDSLGPMFDGWYAVIHDRRDPPTDDLIGCLCAVETSTGQILIKMLRRGSAPGLWDLYPAYGNPITDCILKWAAPVDGIERGDRRQG